MSTPHWASTKIDAELANLLNEIVDGTPGIEGKSDLLRFGIHLALSELLRENRITDPQLRLRVFEYLHHVRGNGFLHVSKEVSSKQN